MTRRIVLAVTAVAFLGLVAPACAPAKKGEPQVQSPCDGPDGVGGPVPDGAGPGDLVDQIEITDLSSPGFPSGARAWRILYVSTAADEDDLRLVCGTVTMPTGGPSAASGTGRLLAWSHGTQGLEQRCLPSGDPPTFLWGKMPGGIQTVAYGNLLGKHEGEPEDGLLQHAVDEGWLVAAADYQPDTYVLGRVAGANVLDSTRAATQLAADTFADTPDDYDLITYGHSQGGHAALWAGQLAETYLAGTEPGRATADITLAGVAALAPASTFIADPQQQRSMSYGDGLADQEMHEAVPLLANLPIPALEVQIGPALFSYIFGSWEDFSRTSQPAADSEFPASPGGGPLDLSAVATDEGTTTIETVKDLCLVAEGSEVKSLVAPYRDAAEHRMLVPELWNLPTGYRSGEYFRGGVDRACAETSTGGLSDWCDWIRWNLPGPLGTSPFPTAPEVDGEPVPLLIGQGQADDIIHCLAPGGLAADEVPAPSDCMSTALFEAFRDREYCRGGDAAGHLDYVSVRARNLVSPATHLSLPGELSARKLGRSDADLRFDGSPLERFMTGAFEDALEPGCRARVLNP